MMKSPDTPATEEENTYEKALAVLDRIWPLYDTKGYGIMTIDMEKVLHHVEEELGTSLLDQAAWSIFREFVARAQGTIVNQKDLVGLLGLVHGNQQQIRMQMQQQQQPQRYDASLQDNTDHYSHDEQGDLLSQHSRHHDQHHQQQLGLDEQQYPEDLIYQTGSTAVAPRAPATAMAEATSAPPPSSLSCRPRTSPPIRRIALQTPSSYPRFRSSLSTNSLALDTETSPSHHHTSPGLDARSTSSGRSPSPMASIHNTEEYEGYGLDAEPDHIDQDDFMRIKMSNVDLDRKLKRAQLDYAMRSDEQSKETKAHQEEIDRLNQALKTTRKEIIDLKYTEKSQSGQIQELEQQIQVNEKTSQTQKNGAAALRMQRDELEMENQAMQDSLRRKEKELEDLVGRLKTLEEESHRIAIDQDQMKELQEQLESEISKNQAMASELEFMRKRLRDEVEQFGGSGGIDLNLTAVFAAGVDISANIDPQAKGLSLWSELGHHRGEFDKPLDSELPTPSAAVPSESLGAWGPEDATKLLQESSQNSAQFATFKKKYEMKRSSIRDMSQLYQDHARLRQESSADASQLVQQDTQPVSPWTAEVALSSGTATQMTPAGVEDDSQAGEASSQKKSVVFDTDDVDCALPAQLPPLGVKMGQLEHENRITDSLIDDILEQIGPLAVTATPAPFHRIHRESVRRRKPQASRAVTQAELDELRGESTVGATTVQAMGETSTKVARRENSTKVIANVTLVSMYTIVVYLFGVITSVFLVDSNPAGRQFNFDTLQAVAHQEMAGHGGRAVGFRLVEVFALWINNLISQGDGGYGPT
ncbi:hypothetical protein DFQ26_001641 [Actinomortierella ambigua]|nr:hypothetical protein DFQ26_001641 [Actinomortierella ambigua]